MSVNTVALSPIIGCVLVDAMFPMLILSFCMGDPWLDMDSVLGFTNLLTLGAVGVTPPKET